MLAILNSSSTIWVLFISGDMRYIDNFSYLLWLKTPKLQAFQQLVTQQVTEKWGKYSIDKKKLKHNITYKIKTGYKTNEAILH